MSARDLSECLCDKVPLFDGLSAEQCRQVLDIADECQFKTGEVLVFQGREMQRLWILLEGEVEVIKQFDAAKHGGPSKSELILATLAPYANFGEMSFFHKAPHSASVRAKTPVKALRIERAKFDTLLDSISVPAYRVMMNTVQTLADRMRRMDAWVAELITQQPKKVDEWNQLREQLFDKFSV